MTRRLRERGVVVCPVMYCGWYYLYEKTDEAARAAARTAETQHYAEAHEAAKRRGRVRT